MNNTKLINTFNIDNSNISKTSAQYCQIKKTITNKILEFKLTINMNSGKPYILYY